MMVCTGRKHPSSFFRTLTISYKEVLLAFWWLLFCKQCTRVVAWTHEPFPGSNATFVWKKRLVQSENARLKVTPVDSKLFVHSEDCQIFVLNLQRDLLHHTMSKHSTKSCPHRLTLSQDSSFFLQTGHLDGDT